MPEFSREIQDKIQQILGIPADSLSQYDPAEIINELCDTVFMLDEQKTVAKITKMKDKIASINGRIWNLLGVHDPKKAREDLNGIAELERYVGEMKRRSGSIEEGQGKKRAGESPEDRQSRDEERIGELERRADELQLDMQSLFDSLAEVEELEEELK